MQKLIIYGAGMAGLLAANMLRRFSPVIHEAASELPNNHEALLRFRSDAVSRATGIPFKKVEVTKAIVHNGEFVNPNIALNNMYSYKVTGECHARSIGDLRPVERYIAPVNFIHQMAKSVAIEYGCPLTVITLRDSPIISTIPMPAMMKLCGWPEVQFKFKTIWSVWLQITQPVIELYQTIYYPSLDLPYYRATITGSRLIIEFSNSPEAPEVPVISEMVAEILNDFGIPFFPNIPVPNIKEQKYGKLLPIDNEQRKAFVLALTDKYGIYSLGRFATWRQILMDDVVNDVARIESWITERDAYQRRLQS